MDNEEPDLLKSKKIVLFWLLGLIYSAFIGLQLGRIQAIANFNYNLHEMLYIPANFAIFLVPILFFIYLILSCKSLFKAIKNKDYTISLKTTIKSILVIVSLVIIFWIVGYQSQEISTTGIYKIDQKVQEDSKYYIVAGNRKIRVSQNEYNLINEDKNYMIGYVWNKRSPDKGNLEIIEPMKEVK